VCCQSTHIRNELRWQCPDPEKTTFFAADITQTPTVAISECGADSLNQNGEIGTCWMFTVLIRYSFFLTVLERRGVRKW